MSERRRLVVAFAALGLVLAAVVGVFALRSSTAKTEALRQDRVGPVLLVPGYGGDATALNRLAAVLRASGREVSVLRLPGNGTGPLVARADILRAAATEAIDAGALSVDVVGYSASGVVARLWAAEEGGGSQARRVVTLGSPHHGTEIAVLDAIALLAAALQ